MYQFMIFSICADRQRDTHRNTHMDFAQHRWRTDNTRRRFETSNNDAKLCLFDCRKWMSLVVDRIRKMILLNISS